MLMFENEDGPIQYFAVSYEGLRLHSKPSFGTHRNRPYSLPHYIPQGHCSLRLAGQAGCPSIRAEIAATQDDLSLDVSR